VNASLSDEAALTLANLVPVMRLAGLDDEYLLGSESFDLWRQSELNSPGSRKRAVLYYSLLESLGHPVDPPVWNNLGFTEMTDDDDANTASQADYMPDPVLWHRLSGAARSGYTGETALLALATLGIGGTSTSHPVTISHVIQSMALVGMVEEARALAVEAALAGGL